MIKRDFENIVDEFGPKLYGYLIRFLNNRDDAEDVLQSVFIAFYNHIHHIDPQKYSAYLFRAAHNSAINYKRKRDRYIRLDDTILEEQDRESGQSSTINEGKKNIQSALSKLKAKEILAIELQFYQGKGYEEIAKIMGITVKAVDSLLVRAKRKLRKFLQDSR
ncbi:MAG: sigma-70 family RNA polymerase sigma factor [Candidatus Cloacimonetes bacterium]|nr:sigma-70 family RNA polymerase sigma factor [Candidatus Cloacimonadota bacterium]